MGQNLLTRIVLIILVSLPWSAVLAAPSIPADLEAELNAMADDELIIKFKTKPALRKRLAAKTLAANISPELNKEALSSIVDYYNLPLDESAAENNNYSRLSSSAIYHPLAQSLRMTASDGSTTSLLKLKGVSKLKLHRIISKINAKKLNTEEYEIVAVYPNYLYEITDLPNDPEYSEQKALSQINIDKAWAKSQGEGVVVAVIDTGVDYKHRDLANNIWQNSDEIANNGKDDDHNGYVDDTHGWDFVRHAGSSCIYGEDCQGADSDPSDFNGHGTHVSGIIAAEQNNEFAISGVAPLAKIMPLRAAYSVGSSAYLKSSDVAEAIEYALRNGANVINMSFAGSKLGILADVVNRATELGIVVVAASGNSGSNTETYPAALVDVIAVGSVDSDGQQSSFSNYGDWVDIMAPGVRVLSTIPDDGLAYKTGTSMAAPLVAGVAALVISKSRELNLSPGQVRERIISSSLDTESSTLVTQAQPTQLNADIDYPLQVDTMDLPRVAGAEQMIEFKAAGSEGDDKAASYQWSSDKDGILSDSADFETNALSVGDHKIALRVSGASGTWSEPVYKSLTIDAERRVFSQSAEELNAHILRHDGKFIAAVPLANRGYVEDYIWTSSKDGEIAGGRMLPITKLSSGLHKLNLVIRDKRGFFSEPIERVVEIQ